MVLFGCVDQPAAGAGGVAGLQHIIGPGDTVSIVWRNPEFRCRCRCVPTGGFRRPGRGPAGVGRTDDAARDIEAQLGKYVRDPVVTVLVTSFVGPYSEQIRVVGEAAKPQALPYRENMTLLDVMIAVGGMTDFADGNAATILRTADANKQYGVRLKDLIKRGDVSANVEMRPGDVLIIPQSWF
jgi:polysaccharide export outer membrane protein